MQKVAIRFAEAALADLEALRAWYEEQGVPDVGERLLREIIDSIESLGEHPDMGRIGAGVRAALSARAHPPAISHCLPS
jgi:plasmid stabilization system protein ParE